MHEHPHRRHSEPLPSPRLIAIVTALSCIAGAQGAHAAASAEQLAQIEDLIVSRDCGGLRGYLADYPGLLQGDDPLSEELRNFASGIDSGLISCLSYRTVAPPLAPEAPVPDATAVAPEPAPGLGGGDIY
jgi:hypothetical protein